MDVESESVPKVQDLARLDDTKEEKIDVEPKQDEKSSEENCCSKKKNIIITVSVIGALLVIGIIIAVATGSKGDSNATSSEVVQADLCSKLSCHNDGDCRIENGKAKCDCTADWDGETCENQKDVCVPNPCKHNGECSKDQNGKATCKCKEQYDGDFCENQKDFCSPNDPCKNGVCSSSEEKCDCKSTEFYGKYCESTSLTALVINNTVTFPSCRVGLKDCPDADQVCQFYFCYPKSEQTDPLKSCKKNADCAGIKQTAKCLLGPPGSPRSRVCVSQEDYKTCDKHEDCNGKGGKCCFDHCCNEKYFLEFQGLLSTCNAEANNICKEDKETYKDMFFL